MTLIGQTLGEFEILERLGQGGMGAVYKARQLSLKRLVALKTLQSAVAEDEDYIARFRQEAVAAVPGSIFATPIWVCRSTRPGRATGSTGFPWNTWKA